MTEHYSRVLKFVAEHPWAILPATLDSIVEVLELRAAGLMFTDAEIQARIGAAPARPGPQSVGTVAVIPLQGVIAPKMNLFTQISGGTSTEWFGKVMRQAVDDPDIGAIVIDTDSPGGSVFGVEELATTLYSMRGRKPIVAVSNHLMASAAYWIASQADEIVASPSSQIGSIGAIAMHQDVSEAHAKLGVKTTLITSGERKADGHPSLPLSEEARATMQELVDGYGDAFRRGIAKSRGVKVAEVRERFGEGRIFSATDAVKAGLADDVGTLDQVIARLSSGAKRFSGPRAEVEAPAPAAVDPIKARIASESDELRRRLAEFV